jgi:hypothetical protein
MIMGTSSVVVSDVVSQNNGGKSPLRGTREAIQLPETLSMASQEREMTHRLHCILLSDTNQIICTVKSNKRKDVEEKPLLIFGKIMQPSIGRGVSVIRPFETVSADKQAVGCPSGEQKTVLIIEV